MSSDYTCDYTRLRARSKVTCKAGLQIRERIGKLFALFLIQNICCGYSKELSQ